MRVIHIDEIKNEIQKVLADEVSRSSCSEWAQYLREEFDAGNLSFEPTKKESTMWDTLLFLEGYDTPDFDDNYLFNKDDLEIYLKRL
ncbi:MAG: hypothetical protein LUE98_10735 [Tannerellaceae bacterium]|nr:hypothetical protein [Tannerellaceae bacterium]